MSDTENKQKHYRIHGSFTSYMNSNTPCAELHFLENNKSKDQSHYQNSLEATSHLLKSLRKISEKSDN